VKDLMCGASGNRAAQMSLTLTRSDKAAPSPALKARPIPQAGEAHSQWRGTQHPNLG